MIDFSGVKMPEAETMDEPRDPISDSEFAHSALAEFEAPLLRFAAHLTGDPERAREVVQDTFLKLCSQKPSRIRQYLAQWLYTVCRNRARDIRRKERRMAPIGEAQLEETCDGRVEPLVVMEHEERINQVLRILATLPPNQQEVLRLKFQGDLSYREISRITNLSVSNVGFLIHTGLKTIRERVKNRAGARAVRRVK